MLAFVLDEHMRGYLADAIRLHNAAGAGYHLDIVCVGDPDDLPLRSKDPALLVWAAREGRLVVTFDKRTMPGHLADHLAAGGQSPGVICVSRRLSVAGIIAELEVIVGAGRPEDFANTIRYIP